MIQNPFVPSWKEVIRSLMREAAYLPDPVARRYMRSLIHESYHFHWPHVVPNSRTTPHGQFLLERRARQLLSVLRRANEGYIKPLEKVMLLSYGRIGRRRYELLEPYFGVVSAGKPKYRRDPGPLKQAPPHWEPTLSLQSLIESQSRNHHVKESKVVPVIRAPYPPREQFAKSGRRIPQAKVMQKWYESLLERVLPPLPTDEWHILHGLLVGTEPWELPVRRKRVGENNSRAEKIAAEEDQLRCEITELAKSRTSSQGTGTDSTNSIDSSDSEGQQIDDAYKSAADLEMLTPEFLVFGPEKGQTFRPFVRGRPHRITRRFMGTLWDDVMRLVPRFEYIESATTGIGATSRIAKALPSSEPVQGDKPEQRVPKEAGDALAEEEKQRAKPSPIATIVKRYTVRWGKPENPPPIYYTVDPEWSDLVFAGVDTQGRLTRQKQENDLASSSVQRSNRQKLTS